MRSTIVAAMALLLSMTPVHARDTTNEVLPGCRDYVSVGTGSGRAENADIVSTAECVATVHTILLLERLLLPEFRFCRPAGLTVNDAVELVVKDLGGRPKVGAQPFFIVVIAIFQQHWPCR